MTRSVFIALLITGCLEAADARFDGRWNIKVLNEPRGRAWWLEVDGAKGRFVGAPGGGMYDIPQLSVQDGELRFSFTGRQQRSPSEVYRARLVNGRMEGVTDTGKETFRWVGVRAPEIAEKDDGSWREGTAVALFNGKDLSGWLPVIPGRELGWAVKDGAMTNVAAANNLVSEKKFWNFALRAEYRVGKGSNSGIGLRGRYEVQILEDYGKPPDSHGNGALYSRVVPAVNASRPAGEWQIFDIRLVGRQLTVVLNGRKILDKVEVEGLTAVATDPNESEPGPITLQGDHGPVEFRKLVLTPLTKR
ncbi:MAG: DUF1080 domain-containing protein [Bryobacteraceae bacterium]